MILKDHPHFEINPFFLERLAFSCRDSVFFSLTFVANFFMDLAASVFCMDFAARFVAILFIVDNNSAINQDQEKRQFTETKMKRTYLVEVRGRIRHRIIDCNLFKHFDNAIFCETFICTTSFQSMLC